jgi:hypothetical protein
LLRDHGLDLNLAAGLPIVRNPRLSTALAEYKEFRRKALARAGDDQAALTGPELVRFDPPAAEAAEPAEPKSGDNGKPTAQTPPPKPAPATTARRAQVARPVPTPAPAVPLPPRPVVKSMPVAPLIGAQPAAVATPVPPVPAPRTGGRALSTAEASGLVDRYAAGEPAVLKGDFVVTGVLGRRVALRTRESLRDPDADPTLPGNNAALIVVDYPEGAAIPDKDATFSRDGARGFVIRDVIRGRNGQITIVASERGSE